MPFNSYHLVTHWKVEATPEEVAAILADPLSLPRWWPEVYESVKQVEPGVFELHTRGFLPYRLCWRFRAVESRLPSYSKLRAWGDLEGWGTWRFRAEHRHTTITFEWNVKACKPLLRCFSLLLKPLFMANHRWAMKKGEAALRVELRGARTRLGQVNKR